MPSDNVTVLLNWRLPILAIAWYGEVLSKNGQLWIVFSQSRFWNQRRLRLILLMQSKYKAADWRGVLLRLSVVHFEEVMLWLIKTIFLAALEVWLQQPRNNMFFSDNSCFHGVEIQRMILLRWSLVSVEAMPTIKEFADIASNRVL